MMSPHPCSPGDVASARRAGAVPAFQVGMIIPLLREALSDFREDEAPRIAAALSFYTVFALPPLLILVTMIAGLFWDPGAIEQALVQEIQGALGPEAAEQVRTMI